MSLASERNDIELDEKIKEQHRIDSLNLLLYMMLLITTVLTVWMFKHRRMRYMHETGLALVFGLVVGALIRYTSVPSAISHVEVKAVSHPTYNGTLPPDYLWYHMKRKRDPVGPLVENRTYAYRLTGEVEDLTGNQFAQQATFDPEIFFNIILPPIIFNAGYSLKRKFFFRNLGSILCFAFIGTTISAFVIGGVQYTFGLLFTYKPSLLDCLYFGALISATDPVTILAIFNDLHVDVNLYALVFGESVLNDAVAIVLVTAIENYAKLYATAADGFEAIAFLKAIGLFFYVFCSSFLLGSVMGCATALLTKFTHIRDFPLLESSLFLLMSYSSFLIAEAADLTGIVAVLFCGICQAHYTYNNLSDEARVRTKDFFELINFLTENFIFSYIGVSLFTFPKHQWDFAFIGCAFISLFVGRLLNIYPLSWLLNLRRNPKIPLNFQHMMFLAGLRGAIAFALAIRNTYSVGRQTILTATSIIVAVTVVYGGLTTQLLLWLGIPVGGEAEEDETTGLNQMQRTRPPNATGARDNPEKARLVRLWSNFDTAFMKPLLTNARPTLLETLPMCCHPLARLLTSTQQLTQDTSNKYDDDGEGFLEGDDASLHGAGGDSGSIHSNGRQIGGGAPDDGDLGTGSASGYQQAPPAAAAARPTRVTLRGHGHGENL
ncbi:sodium/hydrogen exchanger 7-like isoform X3 [Amphibalanus amphitrite]|uniref:sodium/hydrogen exchanger 7-like isoform X3 n=1 Tax=Amphibalanus amphitrite TaxID=1232801 RepID=UPI001C910809|nr:sodium/hydrogen exchanger 7-like isoform X3 [Amphibalanus amphitrite]